MPQLVLGPVLRYVGEHEATIWVETDEACTIRVDAGGSSATADTFRVGDHHYALAVLEDLEAATTTPYTVAIDEEAAWPPPDYPFPAPTVRTLGARGPLRVAFGSCRVALPHEAPFTARKDDESWGFEHDAQHGMTLRMLRQDPAEWPHLMFACGDQVYADELSPRMRSEIDRRRRAGVRGPEEEAADFQEYTLLYSDAWADPALRWFLSVVPTAMVFDDHDVQDDWNTSWSWMEDRRKLPWWNAKMAAALGSYWIYQHIGNLSPRELEDDEMWQQVGGARRPGRDEDLWPLIERFGVKADRDHTTVRWSFCRDLDATRLIV